MQTQINTLSRQKPHFQAGHQHLKCEAYNRQPDIKTPKCLTIKPDLWTFPNNTTNIPLCLTQHHCFQAPIFSNTAWNTCCYDFIAFYLINVCLFLIKRENKRSRVFKINCGEVLLRASRVSFIDLWLGERGARNKMCTTANRSMLWAGTHSVWARAATAGVSDSG